MWVGQVWSICIFCQIPSQTATDKNIVTLTDSYIILILIILIFTWFERVASGIKLKFFVSLESSRWLLDELLSRPSTSRGRSSSGTSSSGNPPSGSRVMTWVTRTRWDILFLSLLCRVKRELCDSISIPL